jgi:hypothetical protein
MMYAYDAGRRDTLEKMGFTKVCIDRDVLNESILCCACRFVDHQAEGTRLDNEETKRRNDEMQ